MARLPILIYNHPILRKKALPISKFIPGLKKIINDIIETMIKANGIGLAAPQIGHSLRLFVIYGEDTLGDIINRENNLISTYRNSLVFVNPKVELYGSVVAQNEACLSIPGIQSNINRLESAYISYYDHKYNQTSFRCSGLLSRVIQHEYDHLNGVLFIDYLSKIGRALHANKLRRILNNSTKCSYPTTNLCKTLKRA